MVIVVLGIHKNNLLNQYRVPTPNKTIHFFVYIDKHQKEINESEQLSYGFDYTRFETFDWIVVMNVVRNDRTISVRVIFVLL